MSDLVTRISQIPTAMPRVKQFNEEQVLEKAMEVFWKKGYNGSSMQELVEGMGINRASIYDTFGSKEELFERAFEIYREKNLARIRNFLFSQQPVQHGLLLMFEKAIDQAIQDPDTKGCFVVNATTEMVKPDCTITSMLNKNRIDFEIIFYEYLREGVSRGELGAEKDLKSIAALIYTLYSGIMVLAKVNQNKPDLMAAVRAGLHIIS